VKRRRKNPAHQTILVDGVHRPVTNSLGRPIARTEEAVRNFWRWFGDSKVVDGRGRPMVVYHGTASSFARFRSRSGNDLRGVFFSGDRDDAREWGEMKGGVSRVVTAYLRILRPADGSDLLLNEPPEKATRRLRRTGVDGYADDRGGATEYVVFSPAQIRVVKALKRNPAEERRNPERPGDQGLRIKAEKMHREAVSLVRRGGFYWGQPGKRGVVFPLDEDIKLVVCDDREGKYAGRLRSFRRGSLTGPLEYEIVLNVHAGRYAANHFATATPLPDLYERFAATEDFGALARIVDAMRSTFVHEATHLLDSQRTNHAGLRGGALPEEFFARRRAYINSPAEMNAFYQALASGSMDVWRREVRKFIRGSDGLRRMHSLRKLAQRFQAAFFSTANGFARDFLTRLREHVGDGPFYAMTAKNRARLRKRAAGLWESLRAMTRAEIELRRRETQP
jgi:hypothetical protein